MFIKFVDINCFLCNSYPSVLFENLPHAINQESHIYSWNLGKIYLVHFLKFWNQNFLISKFQKSELGKFIPNFPLKHVTTSTNHLIYNTKIYFVIFNFQVSVLVPYSLQSMQCFQMQKRIILSQVYCYSKN